MKGADAVAAWMMRRGSCPTAYVDSLGALHGRPAQRSLKPEPDPERDSSVKAEDEKSAFNRAGSTGLKKSKMFKSSYKSCSKLPRK